MSVDEVKWPALYDHELRVGATYVQYIRLVEEDTGGTRTAITGYSTGQCVIRNDRGEVLLEPTVTFPGDGVVRWESTAAATAALTHRGRAKYTVRVTFDSGSVHDVIEGVVQVKAGAVT